MWPATLEYVAYCVYEPRHAIASFILVPTDWTIQHAIEYYAISFTSLYLTIGHIRLASRRKLFLGEQVDMDSVPVLFSFYLVFFTIAFLPPYRFGVTHSVPDTGQHVFLEASGHFKCLFCCVLRAHSQRTHSIEFGLHQHNCYQKVHLIAVHSN